MEEIWKDVEGYEGHYQVSNLGNVKALTKANQYKVNYKPHMLKPRLNRKGYVVVTIGKNGGAKVVHRMVAKAFIPNPNNYEQVNHIDGNKQNNNVSNLEWCTNDMNMKHAHEHGLFDNVYKILKKPINQLNLDGTYIRSWDSASDVMRKLGYDCGHIRECCRGIRKTASGYRWENKQ